MQVGTMKQSTRKRCQIYLLSTNCMHILWYRKVVFIVRCKNILSNCYWDACRCVQNRFPYYHPPLELSCGFDRLCLCQWPDNNNFVEFLPQKQICLQIQYCNHKEISLCRMHRMHEKLVSWAVAPGQPDKIWIFYWSEPGRPIFVGQ